MENRIKELRKKYRMSQIHLSIELEVSQETVSAYEKGKYYPSFQTLLKLSKKCKPTEKAMNNLQTE